MTRRNRSFPLLLALSFFSSCEGDPTDPDKTDDTSLDTSDSSEDSDSGEDSHTGDDTHDDTDDEPPTLDGTCADAVHWGAFTIDSNADYAYASGGARNGVVPATILTELETLGGCTIWRRENPFCDPACGTGFVCDFSGECIAEPQAQDLGTVEVEGLLQPVSMTPYQPGYLYYDTSLPNPPWVPGSLATLESSGGSFSPVTLHGYAPEDLLAKTMAWNLVEGEALPLVWEAAQTDTPTELVLGLTIDLHGTTPASLECVFPDTGSAEVPAEILDAFLGAGISGFPNGSLMRRTADHAELGEGCVDLVLSSSKIPTVSIEGYTPCNRDEECPKGMTCNEAMQRCE